jgi:arsenate reductase-like glutaredoxin family protein
LSKKKDKNFECKFISNSGYYLKTCDTCKRILKQLKSTVSDDVYASFVFQEIKTQPITVKQLEGIHKLTQSYEALFSRRAKKYKQMDLKNQTLSELDYKQLILDEYTFLKRPVIIIDDTIFVGNSKKNVDMMLEMIKN